MISDRSKAIAKQKKFSTNSKTQVKSTPKKQDEDAIPKHLIEVTKLPLR